MYIKTKEILAISERHEQVLRQKNGKKNLKKTEICDFLIVTNWVPIWNQDSNNDIYQQKIFRIRDGQSDKKWNNINFFSRHFVISSFFLYESSFHLPYRVQFVIPPVSISFSLFFSSLTFFLKNWRQPKTLQLVISELPYLSLEPFVSNFPVQVSAFF